MHKFNFEWHLSVLFTFESEEEKKKKKEKKNKKKKKKKKQTNLNTIERWIYGHSEWDEPSAHEGLLSFLCLRLRHIALLISLFVAYEGLFCSI